MTGHMEQSGRKRIQQIITIIKSGYMSSHITDARTGITLPERKYTGELTLVNIIRVGKNKRKGRQKKI